MRHLVLTVLFLAAFSTHVAAQFSVKLEMRANDRALETTTKQYILEEFESFKDVSLTSEAKYGLIVEIIKRPIDDKTSDVFVTVVATSAASCVLALDSRGRVESRQGCREFLTLNTFVGRETELEQITKDIVTGFNSFVFDPLREIGRETEQL